MDGRLQRLAIVLDPTADWPKPPPKPKPKSYTITLPWKYRERWVRAEHEAAEAARRAEVEARHYRALNHLGVITASTLVRERGSTPAWAHALS